MDPGVTTHKFVAVLNKKIESGRLFNALAHATAGFVASASPEEKTEMGFVDYINKDDQHFGPLSKNGYIILAADNGNKIRTLRNAAKEAGIRTVAFTHTCFQGTYLDQIKQSSETPELDMDYFALVLFGPKEKVDPLTKKFSLWK